MVDKSEFLTNDLWILIIGNKPLEWIKPEILGLPPSPRYLHSMNFYEEGNYLIIHGGRNDNKESDNAHFGLNDFFILELWKLEWMQVKVQPSWSGVLKIHNRCGHSSIIHGIFLNYNLIFKGSRLLILGGMNEEAYLGSTFFCVELSKF